MKNNQEQPQSVRFYRSKYIYIYIYSYGASIKVLVVTLVLITADVTNSHFVS